MEVGVRLIGIILRILNFLSAPFYWLRGHKDNPRLTQPPPLLMKSAKELAALIRDGELTSEELVKTSIKRIKEVNVYLNAVVEERYVAAIEDAKAADQEVAAARKNGTLHTLAEKKPLLGVPCTVKESCSLAGLSDSVGCLEKVGSRAREDGAAVALVRAAGAVPLAVTNTPELCLGWESTNLLRGATCNPYRRELTAGGSSGGEGALLGAGASAFGVASDIAGSIRVPSAFCGVFGHKPTPGIVPVTGHVPTLNDPDYARFLVVGPMARRAEDLPLLLSVMAGPNRDRLRLQEPVDFKKLKVTYMTEAAFSPALLGVHRSIKEMIVKAADYLHKECGATISQEKFKDLEDSVEMSVSIFFSMKDIPDMLQDPTNPKRSLSAWGEAWRHVAGGATRSLQALGFAWLARTRLFIPARRHRHYAAQAQRLLGELRRALGTEGVLLYPVSTGPAHRHHQVFVRASAVLYTMLFNVLGLPATSVPMGLHNGLPIAIQVIAAPNQDRLCLAVARQLEIGFGGWRPPP